ncbi:MAG: hypothetical protein EXS12_07955 [Phycisphaerales bacterium]|nr:hypothetical protein [Phycisphaerales bacterium]
MPRHQTPTSEFLLEECKTALQTLQGALLSLIKACGADQDHAFALSQRLDLDKSLAWRIMRFSKEHDVNQAVEYLPGDSGLNIFINKCQRGSSTRGASDRAQKATADLSSLAKRVGGSRSAFKNMLMQGGANPARSMSQIALRKQAFMANEAIWGIRASVRWKCWIQFPAKDPTKVHLVRGDAFIGLTRLRGNVSWPLYRRSFFHYANKKIKHLQPTSTAVDKKTSHDFPLLTGFGTLTAKDFTANHTSTEYVWSLPAGSIGKDAATDCFFGEIVHTESTEPLATLTRLDLPVEEAVIDIFLHNSLLKKIPMHAYLFNCMTGGGMGDPEPNRESDLMPLIEAVEVLPQADLWPVKSMAMYSAAAETLFNAQPFAQSEFTLHRISIKYPAIPTALVMKLSDKL